MSEVSLIGDGAGFGGGNALAAGFGALIGGAIGGAWGNGGWGGRGNWGPGFGCGCENNGVRSAIAENAILGNLNDINTGVTNLGMNLIQGQGRNDLTACQGFNGINTAILTTSANQTNWTNQGFAGLNTAIVQNGFETRQEIANNRFAMQQCCCDLKQQVAAGFCDLASKIDKNTITELQTRLCDAKSRIASLESQQFTTASNLAQSQFLISQLKTGTAA